MPVTAGLTSVDGDEDEDLAPVLHHIAMDAKRATRTKIVNSRETRELLEIGLELLRADLLDHCGPDLQADSDEGTRLLAGLSQARLIEFIEEGDRGADRPRQITVGMYRDRWRYKSRYTEDLIAYVFRPGPQLRHLAMMNEAAGALIQGHTLDQLIRKLSRDELAAMLHDPLVTVQTILQVAMPSHPRIREFMHTQYEQLLPMWARIYEQVGEAYDLKLRPGRTWMDVAILFNAVIDGALIRARCTGAATVLSSGEDVLTEAIFAILPSLADAPTSDWTRLRSGGRVG